MLRRSKPALDAGKALILQQVRQAKAVADPGWAVYQAGNGHRVIDQKNRYLVPTKFSPIK